MSRSPAECAKLRVMSPLTRTFTGTFHRAAERYLKEGRPSRTRYLGQGHPAFFRGRPLDGLAHGLDRRALGEIGLPGPLRPALEQVPEMVHEARAVADTLADRPPMAGVGVRLVLDPDPPHPVHRGIILAVT